MSMILVETEDLLCFIWKFLVAKHFGTSLKIVILSVLARILILVHVYFLDCKIVKLLAGCYKSNSWDA